MRLVNFTLLIIRTINADADEQNRAVLLVDLMRQQRRSKEPAIDMITFLIFLRLLQSVMFWRRWHKGCLLHLRRRRWRRRNRSNPHHSRMMM